jgi:hypothetical protein
MNATEHAVELSATAKDQMYRVLDVLAQTERTIETARQLVAEAREFRAQFRQAKRPDK